MRCLETGSVCNLPHHPHRVDLQHRSGDQAQRADHHATAVERQRQHMRRRTERLAVEEQTGVRDATERRAIPAPRRALEQEFERVQIALMTIVRAAAGRSGQAQAQRRGRDFSEAGEFGVGPMEEGSSDVSAC